MLSGIASSFVVLGGTYYPPTTAHAAAFRWLRTRYDRVEVVTAVGHEGKPDSIATFIDRDHMARLAFGCGHVWSIEPSLVPEVGLPVMSIDVLRAAKRRLDICGHWCVKFAVGHDVDVESWTGYREIVEEGYEFVRLPDLGDVRSTELRRRISLGEPWEHLAANAAVVEYMKRRGLCGLPRPERAWLPPLPRDPPHYKHGLLEQRPKDA